MNTKNITLALGIKEYEYLGTLKKQFRVKSYSQLIVNLIDFYEVNRGKMDQLEGDRVSFLEKLEGIQDILLLMKETMVTQQELSYLKTNLDLIRQNYDVVQSLMSRLDAFQDSIVKQKDHDRLYLQVENLEKLVEKLMSNALDEGKFAKDENREIKALLKAKQKLRD